MYSFSKQDVLVGAIDQSVLKLPTPPSLSYAWGGGSLLGLCLVIQLLSGVFLAMHYCSDVSVAFSSVSHIMRDVSGGWAVRVVHANGASAFFVFLYIHIGRGLYFNSYRHAHVWMVGVSIFLITMATAFLGYVLPWGQMSFWGATVITNLFSAIPWVGGDIVAWLWGGFAVDQPTLSRFFSLHYLMPFVLAAMVVVHLVYLHEAMSSNPLGLSKNIDKVAFHPYFSYKDVAGFIFFLWGMMVLILMAPWLLGDVENFIPANPLVTPAHIQPEWYFLFAYAILRAIPNKAGGVLALVFSVAILYMLPALRSNCSHLSRSAIWFWALASVWGLLTFLGAQPVESPYDWLSGVFTLVYFFLFMALAI